MKQLMLALDCAHNALRRDECGDYRINGRRGHICRDGPGWLLCVAAGSARAWNSYKRRLGFCRVTQDGDAEGCLHLAGLPTPAQASVIRAVLRIPKRPDTDPAVMAARGARLHAFSRAGGLDE